MLWPGNLTGRNVFANHPSSVDLVPRVTQSQSKDCKYRAIRSLSIVIKQEPRQRSSTRHSTADAGVRPQGPRPRGCGYWTTATAAGFLLAPARL
ncbi:hypothetical protein VTH06DRAFT_3844 [Thermothelomyces fergusii]